MNIPIGLIHCLDFALNPRFYDLEYLTRLALGGMERKAPNLDTEVQNYNYLFIIIIYLSNCSFY